MSNKTNNRQVDTEERKNRIAFKQHKKQCGEVDLTEYKYDEDSEDGIDNDLLYQLQKFLR